MRRWKVVIELDGGGKVFLVEAGDFNWAAVKAFDLFGQEFSRLESLRAEITFIGVIGNA